jgi:hypothetical protein
MEEIEAHTMINIENQEVEPEYTGDRYLVNTNGVYMYQDNENRAQKFSKVKPLEEKEDHYTTWNFETEEWYYEPYPDAWAGTAPAIYTQLSPRQARLALLNRGLLDDVEALVATNRVYSIYWEYALEINRYDETLILLATALGLSEEDINALFAEGVML